LRERERVEEFYSVVYYSATLHLISTVVLSYIESKKLAIVFGPAAIDEICSLRKKGKRFKKRFSDTSFNKSSDVSTCYEVDYLQVYYRKLGNKKLRCPSFI